jgi:hypothetical protein
LCPTTNQVIPIATAVTARIPHVIAMASFAFAAS